VAEWHLWHRPPPGLQLYERARPLAEESCDPPCGQDQVEGAGTIKARLVSIALPCRNAASFLPQALDSALSQTHVDLEVIAIDDGSTDETGELLHQAAARDPRVRVFAHDRPLGIIRALNRAVEEATGDFIGRMDADDVLAPDRIERQLEVLTSRDDVGVVGCAALAIDETGRVVGRLPVRCTQSDPARFLALFATPVMHPTLMARTTVMRDFPYRESPECLHVEDYDLFIRMLARGVQFINIDSPLYSKRTHPHGVSNRFEPTQIVNFVNLARGELERQLGMEVDDRAHRVLVNRMTPATTGDDLRLGLSWLDRLTDAFIARLSRRNETVIDEVRVIADQQRIDILGQAMLKGGVTRRAAGLALLVRYGGALRSPQARRYLREKIRPRG
jgi:glycosyltransferase involved in cell wall biosynthesis